MKLFNKLCSFVMAGSLACSCANAAISASLLESDGNLVFSYSGTLNTSAMTFSSGATTSSESVGTFIVSDGLIGLVAAGDFGVNAPVDMYTSSLTGAWSGISGDLNEAADSSTGDALIFVATEAGQCQISPKDGYVSGSEISGTATYNSATLVDWSLSAGTYSWTFVNGEATDTFSLTIGVPAGVPEPSTVALGLGAGAGLLALARRRKQR